MRPSAWSSTPHRHPTRNSASSSSRYTTRPDGQGPDLGPQYLSGIFFTSGLQKSKAEEVMALLRRRGYEVNTFIAPAASVTTPDTPVDQTFWPAEEYHQHYYEKTGGTPYCHFRTKKF